MYDDFSGNYICSIANVTTTDTIGGRSTVRGGTGTSAVGPDGSILRYNLVNLAPANAAPQWYLQVLEHFASNHVCIHTLHTKNFGYQHKLDVATQFKLHI